jgi:hypothetical protein
MIELLKSEVQFKLGIEIKNRGDCQILSDAIMLDLDETLNYNTLRRFFDVDKKSEVKPSRNTLNVLSCFLGYKSYNQFSKQVMKYGVNGYQDEWYSILNKGDGNSIIQYLKERREHQNFADLFIRAIRELILMRKVQMVNLIFNSKKLGFARFSYSESVYVGNAIGILLRDFDLPSEDYITLLRNKRFVQNVLSIFVDYASLNSGYGSIVLSAQKSSKHLSISDYIFFKCLNYLRLYLKNERFEKELDADFMTFEGHPILVGRIAAVEMLRCESDSFERIRIFEKLKVRYEKEKVKRLDYFYEIKIVALILSDFELMEMIDQVYSESRVTQQYQISHNQLFCIVKLLKSIASQSQNETSQILGQIKQDLWVTSYYEFFNLFYQIGLYHAANKIDEREKHRALYLEISEKMNYQKFDEGYLKNYFV